MIIFLDFLNKSLLLLRLFILIQFCEDTLELYRGYCLCVMEHKCRGMWILKWSSFKNFVFHVQDFRYRINNWDAKIYQIQFPSYFEIQDACTRLGISIFHYNILEELSEANHVLILWRLKLRLWIAKHHGQGPIVN